MQEPFKIQRLIGKSATGGIYEATELKNGRKILLQRFFADCGDTSVKGWDYTFREVIREWKLVKHPRMVKLHDAGIDEDGAYMSMHYFESEPILRHFEEVMSFTELYNFANQALSVLGYLHQAHIVHGALTPNSFLVSNETINNKEYYLCDLGLSKLVPLINRGFAKYWLPSDPAILAPELFEKHKAVAVTDIYMLGHIFYYLVIGAHPFADLPDEEAERRHFAHEIPRIDELIAVVPESIATWIQAMMLPHPDDRTGSVQEIINNMPSFEIFQQTDLEIIKLTEEHAFAATM